MKLFVEQGDWDKAMSLVKANPKFGEIVYIPYANWLAINDQFEKAQSVLISAGKPDAALKVYSIFPVISYPADFRTLKPQCCTAAQI